MRDWKNQKTNMTKQISVQYKRRALYDFTCTKCGKSHRRTLKYKNLKDGALCAKCRRLEVDKNQLPLLPVEQPTAPVQATA